MSKNKKTNQVYLQHIKKHGESWIYNLNPPLKNTVI